MNRFFARWFLFLCFGLLPMAAARAQVEDLQQATEEKVACIRNLKTIYEAIQKYQADHKELPNWLSDLVPQYLDDVTVLTCPVCKRTGEAQSSVLADPKISTSYDYQFAPVPLGKGYSPNDPNRTYRDWKRQQMALVGSIVPLVRCRHHNAVLNLAYDGRVYESAGGWELSMTNQVDPAELEARHIFSNGAEPAAKPVKVSQSTGMLAEPEVKRIARPPLVIPPRDAATKTNLLDLTTNYNAMLTEAWLGRPDNDLATFPLGEHTFDGVDYDARGLIQLAGKGDATKKFPLSAKGIVVNQKCARLHFLHSTAFGTGVTDGARIGTYIVHFASNDMNLEIPIVYGHDVRDWHTLPNEKTNPPELNVVWTGMNKASAIAHRSLRMFSTTWENPAPAVEIQTIDFVSAQSDGAPFLLAITVDPL